MEIVENYSYISKSDFCFCVDSASSTMSCLFFFYLRVSVAENHWKGHVDNITFTNYILDISFLI